MAFGRKEQLSDRYQKKEDGSYEYTGDLWRYDAGMIPWKKALTRLWAFTLLSTVLQVAAGCIPATGMVRTLYVLLPYIVGFCTTLYLCYKMVELSFSDPDLKDHIYQKTLGAFDAVIIVIQIALAATAAGEIIRLFIETENSISASLAVIGLLAAAFMMLYLFKQAEGLMNFEKIPGKNGGKKTNSF